MEFLVACCFEIIARLVVWVVLLPLALIVTTPFILIVAMLQRGPYRENVRAAYRDVFRGWLMAVE
jgi:hypothetical protein